MFPATEVQQDRPTIQHEPRIWAGRIYTKGGPIAGYGFVFKAPYGVYMNAAIVLTRAAATGQIIRYQIGPLTTKGFRSLDRKNLERYDEVFDRLGRQLNIDWSA